MKVLKKNGIVRVMNVSEQNEEQNEEQNQDINNTVDELLKMQRDETETKEVEEQTGKPKRIQQISFSSGDKEKDMLLKKIELYYRNFPDELVGVRRPRGLTKASIKELNDFLTKIDNIVSGSASHDMVKSAYYSTISVVEMVAVAKTPLKLNGWSDAVANNPYIDKQLKRLEVKYMAEMECISEPETALLSATILTGLAVHRTNSHAQKTAEYLDTRTVPDEMVDKYKDL